MHRIAVHDFVVVVVCRGMLYLVLCVVDVVVDGCIMCMVFRGILYLILCAVDYSLTCALVRCFSSCLFFRVFCDKCLRGFFLVFSPVSASLFGWFFLCFLSWWVSRHIICRVACLMLCPGFSWNFFLLERVVYREFFSMVFFNIVVFPLSLEIV